MLGALGRRQQREAEMRVRETMTKRERVLRTIERQETDRVPVYDIYSQDGAIELFAGERVTVENGLELACRAIRRSLDMTRSVKGPAALGEAVNRLGIRVRRERWTAWIEERPWRDEAGAREWLKGLLRDAEAWRATPEYLAEFRQGLLRKHELIGDDTVVVVESGVGLTEIYHALGLETFSYLLADDPDLVIAVLEARSQAELRRVAAIADPELIPVALTYDDVAYKGGTLLSPAWLRREWLPRLKRLNDAWHERGARCLFHSDGNLMAILPDLIAAGIDGLNPIEVAAGMSLREVKRLYGDRLFFAGGIDVSQLMALGSEEEVRGACRQAIADAGPTGYFLGSTTELHPGVRPENVRAMVETAWETPGGLG
jgi:hypothetical protein